MIHKAIAIIPARGGSKRIPRKNLVDLGGKPLLAYSILSAKKSLIGDSIYVSTEDKDIAEVSKKFGAKIIERPNFLAKDKVSTLETLKQATNVLEEEKLDFDTIALLQATSPFRGNKIIDNGILKLWKNWDKLDVIFSIRPSHHPYYWQMRIKNDILEFVMPNDFSKVRSQDFDKTYEIDGVLYVMKKDFLKRVRRYQFSKGRSGYIISGKLESFEVDEDEDLEMAKALVKFVNL